MSPSAEPPRLVTPDLITAACIDVVATLHTQHLAALERDKGLAAGTIEPLKTVAELAGEGIRLREDIVPAVLIGTFGTTNTPTTTTKRKVDIDWTVAAEVWVAGTSRADVLKRRDWYTLTLVECLLQRLPRHAQPIDALALTDIEFQNGRETDGKERTVGHAQVLFSVTTRAAIDLNGLPPADTDLPPGSPGGPPASTYDPPVDWPPVSQAHSTIDKEAL